jgi:hypothetical protein
MNDTASSSFLSSFLIGRGKRIDEDVYIQQQHADLTIPHEKPGLHRTKASELGPSG